MAQRTITVNPSNATATANGKTHVPFTVNVTPPSFPDGVRKWDSIDFSGTASSTANNLNVDFYDYSNKMTRNVDYTVSVNLGTNVTSAPTSYSGEVYGSTGSIKGNFTMSNIAITYKYTESTGEVNTLYVKLNNAVKEVLTVYKKVNGIWTVIEDPADLDSAAKYVKGN